MLLRWLIRLDASSNVGIWRFLGARDTVIGKSGSSIVSSRTYSVIILRWDWGNMLISCIIVVWLYPIGLFSLYASKRCPRIECLHYILGWSYTRLNIVRVSVCIVVVFSLVNNVWISNWLEISVNRALVRILERTMRGVGITSIWNDWRSCHYCLRSWYICQIKILWVMSKWRRIVPNLFLQ